MRMYQDTRRLDFHALGREIKRKREAKGWTQEYLAQLVDRTPRSIMYFENREWAVERCTSHHGQNHENDERYYFPHLISFSI